jgi:hypothetical protein
MEDFAGAGSRAENAVQQLIATVWENAPTQRPGTRPVLHPQVSTRQETTRRWAGVSTLPAGMSETPALEAAGARGARHSLPQLHTRAHVLKESCPSRPARPRAASSSPKLAPRGASPSLPAPAAVPARGRRARRGAGARVGPGEGPAAPAVLGGAAAAAGGASVGLEPALRSPSCPALGLPEPATRLWPGTGAPRSAQLRWKPRPGRRTKGTWLLSAT